MGDKNKLTVFSDSVSEELRDTVRRIQGVHDSFSTDFMSLSTEPDAMAERVEAWRGPNGLWQIERFSAMPGGMVRQEPVAGQLCFFDALHYCVRFQTTAEASGALPVKIPGARWDNTPHFRVAAKETGQAIDEDGEVHPCAFGRVLTGGWFSQQVYDDALKTKDAVLSLPPPAQNFVNGMLQPLLTSDTPLNGDEKQRITQSVERRDVVNLFRKVLKAGDAMIGNLTHAVNNEFKTAFTTSSAPEMVWVGTVLSLGMLPFIAHAVGAADFGNDRSFKLLKDKFNQAVAALPDCVEKNLAIEFSKAVGFAFWMEHAARHFEDCRQTKLKSTDAEKGLKYIQKAGEAANLGRDEINRLNIEYLAGKVLCKSFSKKVDDDWGREYEKYRDDSVLTCFKTGVRGEIAKKVIVLESDKPLLLALGSG